jgi:hypothetical protein
MPTARTEQSGSRRVRTQVIVGVLETLQISERGMDDSLRRGAWS